MGRVLFDRADGSWDLVRRGDDDTVRGVDLLVEIRADVYKRQEEARHKILSEAQHLFLERGYDRTSLQMIAEKAGVSKGSLYCCFTSKEELFYELTDSAAARLKALLVRLRGKRFDPATGRREYQIFESEEVISMLLEEKYGLLLIMEQAQGTRYEDLSLIHI